MLAIQFVNIQDNYSIPNTYSFNLPTVKTLSTFSINYTVQIYERQPDNTLQILSPRLYNLTINGVTAVFTIKNFTIGSQLVFDLFASAAPYKTNAVIDVTVYCSDSCSTCSIPNTCDLCQNNYVLNNLA